MERPRRRIGYGIARRRSGQLDMLRHVAEKAFHIMRPRVTVTPPPTGEIIVERDVEVAVRDGTILRVNVYRPDALGPHPVILSHHPYGKDATPFHSARTRRGRTRYPVPAMFRLLRQTQPISFSAWTGWEAPDPAVWVPLGYVVVNADLRGWGKSDGVGELLRPAQEGRDGHDLVEWAGTQPWSTGKVGLAGVSYLALSQWATAAERPAHLAAICPWEGLTDVYRDHARPGGIREDGFIRLWAMGLKRQHRSPVTLRREVGRRERWDQWWADRCAEVEAIEVAALVCGSFSDHNLHSRGSFEGFRRIGSTRKWLHTTAGRSGRRSTAPTRWRSSSGSLTISSRGRPTAWPTSRRCASRSAPTPARSPRCVGSRSGRRAVPAGRRCTSTRPTER